MEGAYFVKNQKLLSFSEQQLVDCNTKSHGCKGGLMDNSFVYYETNKVDKDLDYKYTAKTGTTCLQDQYEGVTTISSYKDVP